MNTVQQPLTFLIADDHSLIRQGMAFIIEDLGLDATILQACNIRDILATLKDHEVDIAIIDAHYPDGNILSHLAEIRQQQPRIRILIYTGIDEQTQALRYLNSGANGFLSKMSEEEEVQNAIEKMIEEGEYFSKETRELLVSSIHNRTLINPLYALTGRELQIAELYASGLGNLEIANTLGIKQNTVSTLKKRIFEKLDVDNIVDLAEIIRNHR